MAFELFDTVRVADIIAPKRVVDGSSGSGAEPQPGETGTIVDVVDDGVYLVECVDDTGDTLWVAELLEDELELME